MACQLTTNPTALEEAPASYAPADPRLAWQMVTAQTRTEPQLDGVHFRIVPPARVQGDELLLAGVLENASDRPAIVRLFGVDWQPLTLRVHYKDGLSWKPPCPDAACAPQPPVPPPAFQITLPARTKVEFTGRYDLRTIAYQGSPTALFTWRFDYAGTREADSGVLSVSLPPR